MPAEHWRTEHYNRSCESWIWEKDRDWELDDWEDPETYKWTVPPEGAALTSLLERWKRLCIRFDGPGAGGFEGSVIVPGPGGGGATPTMPSTGGTIYLPSGGWRTIARAATGRCLEVTYEAGLLGGDPGVGPDFDLDDILDLEYEAPDYTRVPFDLYDRGADTGIGATEVCFPAVDSWRPFPIWGAFGISKFVDDAGVEVFLVWVLGSQNPIPFVVGQPLCFTFSLDLRALSG